MKKQVKIAVWVCLFAIPLMGIVLSPMRWVRWRQVEMLFKNTHQRIARNEVLGSETEERLPIDFEYLEKVAERSTDSRVKMGLRLLKVRSFPEKGQEILEVREDMETEELAHWLRLNTKDVEIQHPETRKFGTLVRETKQKEIDGETIRNCNMALQSAGFDDKNLYFQMMYPSLMFARWERGTPLLMVKIDTKTNYFDEYYEDFSNRESVAIIALLEAAYGPLTSSELLVEYGSIIFPQFRQFRSMAQMATHHAIEFDKQGRHGDSIAIRRLLLHYGSRMRAGSENFMGELVGIAIMELATYSAQDLPKKEKLSKEQIATLREQRLARFDTYLRTNKAPKLADWVKTEFVKSEEVRGLNKGAEQSASSPERVITLAVSWVRDSLVLSLLLGVLLVGLVAAYFVRFPHENRRTVLICNGLAVMGVVGVVWNSVIMFPIGYIYLSQGDVLRMEYSLLVLGLVAALFLSSMIAFLVALLRRKLSVQGVVRFVAKGSPLVTCLLLWVYWFSPTPNAEREARLGMQQANQHEGKYLAELQGKPWMANPAPIPKD